MITTNLVFSEWTRIFKDPMTTMAAIDRVIHHAVILDRMSMESYRAKEANGQHHRGGTEQRHVTDVTHDPQVGAADEDNWQS